MSSSSHSIEDDINYSNEDQINEPANTVTSDPVFESVTEMQIPEAEHAAATAKETEDQGHGIRVEKDVFYNDETIKYMRIIDTYKKLGVGKDIELPRLVIAGTQNCGKSSLLENLTGLPVPITHGIATRFPIEIILIEDAKFQMKASIILDPKAPALSVRDMEQIQKFNLGKVYSDLITQAEFEELLREASLLFGVPAPLFASDPISDIVQTPVRPISSHLLQIEMRGPDYKSLSFVDTPGLYFSGNENQDAGSIEEIEKLVISLIEEKRTVIVAVMEANQQTVAQKIFKLALDADPTRERTIGVMTKADLLNSSDTDAFNATVQTAANQSNGFTHGWYVVKNRSSTEAKANISLEAARTIEAALFAKPEWSNASGMLKERLGILSLRTGLSNVYCAHIRKEFPIFNAQTRTILKKKLIQLSNMGPPRSTAEEQRSYLHSLVTVYQAPKQQCLVEDFRDDTTKDSDPTLLSRRLSVQKKMKLRDRLKSSGAIWAFQTASPEADEASDRAAGALFDPKTTKNIYTWINYRYQKTKSCAVPGLVPYELVERLFEEQTKDWTSITDDFTAGVKFVLWDAIDYCLGLACNNPNVLKGLKALLREKFELKILEFRKGCYDLIQNERHGLQVIACEAQFMNDIREARTFRFISALARLEREPFLDKSALLDPGVAPAGFGFGAASGSSTPALMGFGQTAVSDQATTTKPATTGLFANLPGGATGGSKPPTIGLFDSLNSSGNAPKATSTLFTSSHPSYKGLSTFAKQNKEQLKNLLTDDRQIIYEIHDILKAYYSTSVQHFTDTVCKMGLNQRFVEETMNLFSKDFIDSLMDAEVASLSAESVPDLVPPVQHYLQPGNRSLRPANRSPNTSRRFGSYLPIGW